MMGMQIFKLKFENFIYQKLKFSQGVRTHLTHLVWVRHWVRKISDRAQRVGVALKTTGEGSILHSCSVRSEPGELLFRSLRDEILGYSKSDSKALRLGKTLGDIAMYRQLLCTQCAAYWLGPDTMFGWI